MDGYTKNLINCIVSASDDIFNKEQVLYVIGGLSLDYNTIVTIITQNEKVSSLDEIFTALRIHEEQQERMNATST